MIRAGLLRRLTCLILALLLAASWHDAALALDSEQQHGKDLLDSLCGRCHATGSRGQSPHRDAPPFRTLGNRKLYDEDFARRLQDGLSTIHKDMPTFTFDARDAGAVINYLRAIQAPRRPRNQDADP